MRMQSVLNREFFNWNQLNFEFYANWRRMLQVYENKREKKMKEKRMKQGRWWWHLVPFKNLLTRILRNGERENWKESSEINK